MPGGLVWCPLQGGLYGASDFKAMCVGWSWGLPEAVALGRHGQMVSTGLQPLATSKSASPSTLPGCLSGVLSPREPSVGTACPRARLLLPLWPGDGRLTSLWPWVWVAGLSPSSGTALRHPGASQPAGSSTGSCQQLRNVNGRNVKFVIGRAS